MSEFIFTNEALIRIGVFAGVFCLIACAEWQWPRRVLGVSQRVRWQNNLGLGLLNTVLLRLIFPMAAVGAAAVAAEQGWGKSQTQRSIGGILGGATVGGVIGHQHGKQKEGIIIGSVLGMLIGNQSGKSKDIREEQQRWEQRQREMAHQERMRRQEQQRIEQG